MSYRKGVSSFRYTLYVLFLSVLNYVDTSQCIPSWKGVRTYAQGTHIYRNTLYVCGALYQYMKVHLHITYSTCKCYACSLYG